jgi:hypothetical protein
MAISDEMGLPIMGRSRCANHRGPLDGVAISADKFHIDMFGAAMCAAF